MVLNANIQNDLSSVLLRRRGEACTIYRVPSMLLTRLSVFLGSTIICRLYKLILPDQAQIAVQVWGQAL